MPPDAPPTGPCAACGSTTGRLRACSRCRRVRYCSRACQTADWAASHKHTCARPRCLDLDALLRDKFDGASLADVPRPCRRCSRPLDVFYSQIWTLPDVLVMHLDRNHQEYGKIERVVDYPIESLDLGAFVANPRVKSAKFDLCAVTMHEFTTQQLGHYSAIVRRHDAWFHACDRTVTVAEPRSTKATILYYRKQG